MTDGNSLAGSGSLAPEPAAPPPISNDSGSSDFSTTRRDVIIDPQRDERRRERAARSERAASDYDEDSLPRETPPDRKFDPSLIKNWDDPGYVDGDTRARLRDEQSPDLIEQPQEKPAALPKPASWSKEKWESLDDSTRALIHEDEERREQWHRSRQGEIDRARHQTEQQVRDQYQEHIQAAQQARQAQHELAQISAAEAQLLFQYQNAEVQFKAKYGDISQGQLDALKLSNPVLAKEISAELDNARAAVTQYNELRARREFRQAQHEQAERAGQRAADTHQQQAHRAQVIQWQQQQDEAFAKANPEFQSDESAREVRDRVVKPYIKEVLKLSDERLAQLWHTSPEFRSAEGQTLLLHAAKYHEAQEKARTVKSVAPPKPQTSPGQGARPDDASFSAMKSAADRGDFATYLKIRSKSR